MEDSPRVRLSWSTRDERSWCPGSVPPRPEEDLSQSAQGWTSFFKRSMVAKLRRRGTEEAGQEARERSDADPAER